MSLAAEGVVRYRDALIIVTTQYRIEASRDAAEVVD
jgi:hypothetical protein